MCSLASVVVHRSTTSETRLTVTGLEPFTNYTCSVSAATIVGSGPAVVKNVVTQKGEDFTFSFPQPLYLCCYTPVVPPRIVTAQAVVMQVINSNVVIQFSIMDAAPPVQVEDIYWNFTNKSSGMTRPITNTTTIILLSLNRLTLTINNAQLSHTGSYMITVSNPAGSSTGSVRLSVLGKYI